MFVDVIRPPFIGVSLRGDPIAMASNIEHWDTIAMQISILNVPDCCQ
jgi:hypothetical protein